MKRIIPPALVVLAAAVTAGGKDPKPNEVSAFMRQKLTSASEVLEGLAIEDYEKIGVHAQKLALISLDSTWQVLQTDEYSQQSNEFRRAAMAMAKAADEKNLDAVALAYVEMTMKCVQCHKYVRNQPSPPDAKKAK